MPTTRSFKSLGVTASNAEIVIPVQPLTGTGYRNTTFSQSENEEGQKFNNNLESPNRNQQQFITTSFTDTIDRRGIVGWSNLVNYDVPAIVWADDGEFYQALLPSGPDNGGAIDPATEITSTFWIPFETDFTFVNGSSGYFRNNETGRTEQWINPSVQFVMNTQQTGTFSWPINFVGQPSWLGAIVYDINLTLPVVPSVWIRQISASQVTARWGTFGTVGGTPISARLFFRSLGVS